MFAVSSTIIMKQTVTCNTTSTRKMTVHRRKRSRMIYLRVHSVTIPHKTIQTPKDTIANLPDVKERTVLWEICALT